MCVLAVALVLLAIYIYRCIHKYREKEREGERCMQKREIIRIYLCLPHCPGAYLLILMCVLAVALVLLAIYVTFAETTAEVLKRTR